MSDLQHIPHDLRPAVDRERIVKSPAGKVLARQFSLNPELFATATVYSDDDRRCIMTQIRLALTDFYVFLERKRVKYGFDPVRALDMLELLLETMSDSEFHQSIVELIARTRDRHLAFYGREPLGVTATLPFLIERCRDDNDTQYVVTKIASGFQPEYLEVGSLVTHWNGMPIERFIRLNANIFDGGNEAASLARSLQFLTNHPLNRFATPLEEWVDLRFALRGTLYEERFIWQGFHTTDLPKTPPIGRNITGFGGDLELLYLQQVKRVQFAPASFDALPTPPAAAEPGVPDIIGRTANFEFGSVPTEHGTFAYVGDFCISPLMPCAA
jgi:hypothetical protein